MRKRKDAKPLSLDEIRSYQAKLLQNAAGLISDAEVLFVRNRLARCFALCVIAMEEASKVTLLLQAAEAVVDNQPVDWSHLHRSLLDHGSKLRENLLNAKRLQAEAKVPATGTPEWEDVVVRAREMNSFKQDGLYTSIDASGSMTPGDKVATFSRARAKMAVALAKNSYNRADLMKRGFDARQQGLTTVDLTLRFAEDAWS